MEEKRINNNGWEPVLVLLALMFLGLFVMSAIILTLPADSLVTIKVTSILQNLIVFIAPAIVTAELFFKRPFHALGLRRGISWRAVALILSVYVISIPAMNYLVWLNTQMHLPDSMAGVERWMRESEETALELTNSLLHCTNVVQMLEILLIVAVLTGFAEEIFFRGAMINLSIKRTGGYRHVAVWVTAAVFSTLHMQFFGFVPRLLLGAWLGYLLTSTRSLWAPVLAHTFNNGMVVIVTFLATKGVVNEDSFNNIGIPDDSSFPLIATLSAIATIALIVWQLPKLRQEADNDSLGGN